MENDDLASSGSVTPDPESVRPGEDLFTLEEFEAALVSFQDLAPMAHDGKEPSDLLVSLFEVADGDLEHTAVLHTGVTLGILIARNRLLVGRDTPHEAAPSTEAK